MAEGLKRYLWDATLFPAKRCIISHIATKEVPEQEPLLLVLPRILES